MRKNPVQSIATYHNEQESPLGRVLWAGTSKVQGPYHHPSMRELGVYALIYILQGRGSFRNAAEYSCAFEPGDLLILFPEIGHQYGPDSGEELEEFYITFSGPVFDLWKRSGLLDPAHPHFHLEPISLWMEKLQEIIAFTPSSAIEALLPLSRLCTFLSEAHAARSNLEDNPDEAPWLAQARAELGTNLQQVVKGHAIAKQLGISYDLFRHQFRAQTGFSPARYRMNQRIAAACDLLQHSTLHIRQISELLGFNTEFHFSQRFKETKGMSPSEFRRRSKTTR